MRIVLFALSFFLVSPLCALSKPSEQVEAARQMESIGVRTFFYFDESRKRPVTIEFWYPAQSSRSFQIQKDEEVWIHPREVRGAPFASRTNSLPLIVMSHGHGGDRRDRSWLAEKLVQNGYAVASLDHHGNTWSTMSVASTLKIWERPQDVSFAIDSLLEEPILQGYIDENCIGFVGYSLGGLTGLALAGGVANDMEGELERNKRHFPELTPDLLAKVDLSPAKRSYYDQRIKAVFLMAPATWCFSKPNVLKRLKAPLGIVATVSDEVLAFKEHMEPLIQEASVARLKLLRHGETHFIFLNCVSEKGKKVLGERIFKDPPGISREAVHNEIASFATDFFQQFLHASRL